MRTEIVTINNQHFDWIINEKGESQKRILSDKIISKQVIITYDDNDKEISRENYYPTESPLLSALKNATFEEINQIKILLNIK